MTRWRTVRQVVIAWVLIIGAWWVGGALLVEMVSDPPAVAYLSPEDRERNQNERLFGDSASWPDTTGMDSEEPSYEDRLP